MAMVTIRAVGEGASIGDWISVPPLVHRDDPHFVRELDLKERMRLSRWFNPFFRFGEACLFVAYRNGRPVGRLSAQINHLHRQRHDPHSGHFGFFASIDDADVALTLFEAARRWLKARDATSITGPFSFTINEEAGLLIDGFDEPAAMLMNQARPYSGALIEASGLTGIQDTLAFRLRGIPELPTLNKLAAAAERSGAIRLRPVRLERFDEEIRLVIDIFNSAWSANWEFVPFSESEIQSLARELKPFYAAEYGRFVEVDGEAVGVLLAVPDINSVIRGFDGKLLPFNWWRLLSQLRSRQVKAFRIPLMGIRPKYQRSPIAAAMIAMLVREFLSEARRQTFDWAEFSWILETNRPMVQIAQMIAGAAAKRYRFFRGPID